MGLAGQHLEAGAGDLIGDSVAEPGRQYHVELPRQHQRGHGDLREAVGSIVLVADLDLSLPGLYRLPMRESQRLLDDLGYRAIRVRARRVDPREEGSKKARLLGATFGSHLQKSSCERNSASGRA